MNTKRKGGFKEGNSLKTAFLLQGKVYFLTYKGVSDMGKKITKEDLAYFLLKNNQNDRKLYPEKYLICQQTYDSGKPHFHVILIYFKRKQILSQDHYDYLGIHPNIQVMRNMKAALQYVYKEDPEPYTNMDVAQQRRLAKTKDSSSLYPFLYDQMIKDPFNFDPIKYCVEYNLHKQIYQTNYFKALNLIKLVQPVVCNNLLIAKSGFKYINRALIEQKLSLSELKTFDTWLGYQTIVNYLNMLNDQRASRQQKSMNLLITGPPSTGKSALIWQRNPLPGRTSVVNHCSVYPMGMKDWFPDYKSDVYHCIYWNEARLTDYAYNIILQLLDGSPVMLPFKGGGHKKVDNPLIIMTSNMTLDQMIQQKFGYSTSLMQMARKNLAVRIQNVIIPEGFDLFLLQKLMVSK